MKKKITVKLYYVAFMLKKAGKHSGANFNDKDIAK